MNNRADNIKIIREACIKANPEIIELKTGCRFKLVLISNLACALADKLGLEYLYIEEASKLYVRNGGWADFSDNYIFHKDMWEILGRPIRFADVLLAIEDAGFVRGLSGQKKTVKLRPGMTVEEAKSMAYASGDGWLSEINLTEPVKKIILSWNLRADTLDKQSDECLKFLANLLGA